MSFWLTDPELFLYAKGIDPDVVYLWRCNKPTSSSSSSSLVVPMESDDFDFVSKVENHVELIGDMFDWDEPDYKRLVKYIYEKHLLVNSQGFVIAEVMHEADKDGNKKIDEEGNKKINDANEEEEVPAIYYIRSLDVLPLKPYIPKLRERPIPLRTVKYLGDVNGKAAMMEEDSNVTKLTARVDDLETKNKTLDTNVTKLTAGQVAMTDTIDDLKSKNKTLDTNVTKLTACQVAMTDTIDDLKSRNKTMEGKVTKLTADLVTQINALAILQQEVKNNNINAANTKEVWMNDITIISEWVGVEGLTSSGTFDNLVVASPMGTFTKDDSGTNVRARYWYKINVGNRTGLTAISLEALIPNKEKARFSQHKWRSLKFEGKTYAFI